MKFEAFKVQGPLAGPHQVQGVLEAKMPEGWWQWTHQGPLKSKETQRTTACPCGDTACPWDGPLCQQQLPGAMGAARVDRTPGLGPGLQRAGSLPERPEYGRTTRLRRALLSLTFHRPAPVGPLAESLSLTPTLSNVPRPPQGPALSPPARQRTRQV